MEEEPVPCGNVLVERTCTEIGVQLCKAWLILNVETPTTIYGRYHHHHRYYRLGIRVCRMLEVTRARVGNGGWCTPGAIPRFFMKIRRRLRWRDREIIQWTLIRTVFGIPSQRSKCA